MVLRSAITFIAMCCYLPAYADTSSGTLVKLLASNKVPHVLIPTDKKIELANMLREAKSECGDFESVAASVQLIVDTPYPTTGTQPTETVARFLRGKGLAEPAIKQGQIAGRKEEIGYIAVSLKCRAI